VRALITGITGFVGQHLARHLREEGDEVFGLVRPPNRGRSDVPVAVADINDADSVQLAVGQFRPDVIYHLAAQTHVGQSWERRRETLETNFFGGFSILEAARRLSPSPRLLLVGSSEQYGVGGKQGEPLVETDPIAPASPYGVSKAAQELLGQQYARSEGLHVVMVRSFNHTGPGQAPTFVIAEWAQQIAEMEAGKREPVLDVGNTSVRRDFTDVRDIVALYRLLATLGRSGEAYNACSGVARSLEQILETFAELSEVEFEVRPRENLRPVDVPVVVGDPAKAQREVGWKRRFPFDVTLSAVLNDWRRRVRLAGAR